MAALTSLAPAPELVNVVVELWQTHRAEEMALQQLPDAALLCAELFSRLPHDTSLIQSTWPHPDFPDADGPALQETMATIYWQIMQKGDTPDRLEQLLKCFSVIRLQPAIYDFVAMRVLAMGATADAKHAGEFIHFKSARRQFAAKVDQAIHILEPRIHAAFIDCNATHYLSLAAAKDIARIILRRYVHDINLTPGIMEFLSEFVVRYRQRLSSDTQSDNHL